MSDQKISVEHSPGNTLKIELRGDWRINAGFPKVGQVIAELDLHKEIRRVSFDTSAMEGWDSGYVSFLFHLAAECRRRGVECDRAGLQQEAARLLDIALSAVEEQPQAPKRRRSIFEITADKTIAMVNGVISLLDFLGDIALGIVAMFKGRSNFGRDEFPAILQNCGGSALALVTLISILVGVILAFIGAIQLKLLGAQIYIADIVGIAMVRVMGAVMAGILMAGRTGSSFAAELGIMQVNEEIDALRTLGVSPIEFLVLPRLFALIIMMPLLTLYADFMGILGGFIVSTGVLGLNPVEYWNHTQSAVKISNLWVGLVHSLVFGLIIAVAGCLRGIRCGGSAAAVGEATTGAVVEGITWIVIATAVITFIFQLIGV